MAKPLNELLKKVNPEVVQAAKEQAELEILELRLSTRHSAANSRI